MTRRLCLFLALAGCAQSSPPSSKLALLSIQVTNTGGASAGHCYASVDFTPFAGECMHGHVALQVPIGTYFVRVVDPSNPLVGAQRKRVITTGTQTVYLSFALDTPTV